MRIDKQALAHGVLALLAKARRQMWALIKSGRATAPGRAQHVFADKISLAIASRISA